MKVEWGPDNFMRLRPLFSRRNALAKKGPSIFYTALSRPQTIILLVALIAAISCLIGAYRVHMLCTYMYSEI